MRYLWPALALAACAPASYAQTISYQYDALGRLTTVTPASGNPVSYTYDPADNRISVVVQGAGAHPVTLDDVAYGWYGCPGAGNNEWMFASPADNDYDTGGGALTLTSVSGSPYASVYAGGVYYYGPIIYSSLALTYTVTNNIGASANGTLTIYSYQMDPNDC